MEARSASITTTPPPMPPPLRVTGGPEWPTKEASYANFLRLRSILLQKELEAEVVPAILLGEQEFNDAAERSYKFFMEFEDNGVPYPLEAEALFVKTVRSLVHGSGLIDLIADHRPRLAETVRQEVWRETFSDGMMAGYRSAGDNLLDMFLDNEPQFRGIAASHKAKRAVAPEPTPEPEVETGLQIAEDYKRGEPRAACSVNWDGKPVRTPDCGWYGAKGGWLHSGACNQRQRRHRTQTNS